MTMRVFIFFLSLFAVPAFSASLANTSWITIDDKTGKKRSIIALSENDGIITGKVAKIFPNPENINICAKCPGNFYNQPIKDLQIVWGLHQEGDNVWGKGHILDPRTGTIYRVKMVLHGDKLYVRGYVGVSLLGRTQIWKRADNTLDT